MKRSYCCHIIHINFMILLANGHAANHISGINILDNTVYICKHQIP